MSVNVMLLRLIVKLSLACFVFLDPHWMLAHWNKYHWQANECISEIIYTGLVFLPGTVTNWIVFDYLIQLGNRTKMLTILRLFNEKFRGIIRGLDLHFFSNNQVFPGAHKVWFQCKLKHFQISKLSEVQQMHCSCKRRFLNFLIVWLQVKFNLDIIEMPSLVVHNIKPAPVAVFLVDW